MFGKGLFKFAALITLESKETDVSKYGCADLARNDNFKNIS